MFSLWLLGFIMLRKYFISKIIKTLSMFSSGTLWWYLNMRSTWHLFLCKKRTVLSFIFTNDLPVISPICWKAYIPPPPPIYLKHYLYHTWNSLVWLAISVLHSVPLIPLGLPQYHTALNILTLSYILISGKVNLVNYFFSSFLKFLHVYSSVCT